MPREFSRTDRIADQIQKDLADLIRQEMKDPRIGMVTVNGVKVARDLGYADVYVTLLTVNEVTIDSPEVIESLKVLNGAAGFLRSELGHRIRIRTIPRLRFHFDESVSRGRKMDHLIRAARDKDGAMEDEQSGESNLVDSGE